MHRIRLRFYEELNDFLAAERRGREFVRSIPRPTSVKDLIEACGVPHTEVDLILVNGRSQDFSYLVRDGDRASVYPVFESLDITDVTQLPDRPLRSTRFLADVHLGKLVRYLRLAGIDTAYEQDAGDVHLIERMLQEERTLLTRDRRLLMRRAVTKGYLVRSDRPPKQFNEVLRRFDLRRWIRPYSRCAHCNTPLQRVPKGSVRSRLEPLTDRHFEVFSQCPECKRVYWAGSHLQRLDPTVREVLSPG